MTTVPGLTDLLNWTADIDANHRPSEADLTLVETALTAWQDRIEPRLRHARSRRRHWWAHD
ncbi:MAG: hypothetical protein GEU91_20040 [Rhizobiales bacterium]|nr:hypothetical protein [Hyphomicrobiales bacterium]